MKKFIVESGKLRLVAVSDKGILVAKEIDSGPDKTIVEPILAINDPMEGTQIAVPTEMVSPAGNLDIRVLGTIRILEDAIQASDRDIKIAI